MAKLNGGNQKMKGTVLKLHQAAPALAHQVYFWF